MFWLPPSPLHTGQRSCLQTIPSPCLSGLLASASSRPLWPQLPQLQRRSQRQHPKSDLTPALHLRQHWRQLPRPKMHCPGDHVCNEAPKEHQASPQQDLQASSSQLCLDLFLETTLARPPAPPQASWLSNWNSKFAAQSHCNVPDGAIQSLILQHRRAQGVACDLHPPMNSASHPGGLCAENPPFFIAKQSYTKNNQLQATFVLQVLKIWYT